MDLPKDLTLSFDDSIYGLRHFMDYKKLHDHIPFSYELATVKDICFFFNSDMLVSKSLKDF